MSQTMSIEEFNQLVQHIKDEHGPYDADTQGKRVKYIDPHFDMRDNTVFAVSLRGFFFEKTFHTQNECRDLPETLHERVMAFLDS